MSNRGEKKEMIPLWVYLVALAEGLLGLAILLRARHSIAITVIGAILLADAVVGPTLLSLGYLDWAMSWLRPLI
jgi:hypothetical protein